MSTNFFLKKFLLNTRIIPELSQTYHHIYFRNIHEELVAANDLMARFIGFSNHKDIEHRNYKELISHPKTLKQILDNDQMVLNNKRATVANEFYYLKNKRVNFLSIKSPLYDENHLIGVCGVSIIIENLNFSGFMDVVTTIGNLLQESVPKNLRSELFATTKPSRPQLTSRETECLHLYMKGNTTKNIANKLELSHRTIEYYIDNIKSKLGVNKRSELLSLAFNLYPDLV